MADTAGLPDSGNIFAAEGTVAHEILEICLLTGLSPSEFLGARYEIDSGKEDPFVIIVDEFMVAHVTRIVDYINCIDGEVFSELRVDLSKWLGPGEGGTSDVIWARADAFGVKDLKYGVEPVSAVGNKQMLLYALGAWGWLTQVRPDLTSQWSLTTTVHLEILQPRASEAVETAWEITLQELIEFGGQARAAAEATRLPNAPYGPSEKACRWCKARPTCSPRAWWYSALMGVEFESIVSEDVDLPSSNEFTHERRLNLAINAPTIIKWVREVESQVLVDGLRGADLGPLRVGYGRQGHRKFANEAKARQVLERKFGSGIYEKSLRSPAQIETLFGKSALEGIDLQRSEGAPTLVRQESKSQTYNGRRSTADLNWEVIDDD